MAKLNLKDALNTSLSRTKVYIDTELAKKADSSHGTHLTLGTGSGNAFRGDYGNTAYQHSQAAHAPSNAQKNSDITKAEIEAKLTGNITSHTHETNHLIDINISNYTSIDSNSLEPIKGMKLFSNIKGNTEGMFPSERDDNCILSINRGVGNGFVTHLGIGYDGLYYRKSSGGLFNNTQNPWYKIYSTENKPTLADIGAAADNHTHTTLGSVDDRDVDTTPDTYLTRGITPEFKANGAIGLPTNVGKSFAGIITYQQWDDTKGWTGGKTTQFATIDDGRMYFRKGQGTSWESWGQFYTTKHKPTLSDIGAAPAEHGTHVSYGGNGSATTISRSDHTHSYLPLSGGTMTGKITTPNSAQGITIGDDVTLCDRNVANMLVLEGSTATSGGIIFGSGLDTNIYRGGANILKTDDTFNAVSGFQWNGQSLDSRYAAASHGTHLTLGTGSGNAYRGDLGNIAYNHSQAAHAPTNAQKNSDITKTEIENKLTGTIGSHIHEFITSIDTRSSNSAPNTYVTRGIYPEFKSTSTVGLPNVGKNFAGVITYQQWADTSNWSGGKATQFATIDDGRIYFRKGEGTTWGAWNQFYTNLHKPQLDEIGAAPANHNHVNSYVSKTTSTAVSSASLNEPEIVNLDNNEVQAKIADYPLYRIATIKTSYKAAKDNFAISMKVIASDSCETDLYIYFAPNMNDPGCENYEYTPSSYAVSCELIKKAANTWDVYVSYCNSNGGETAYILDVKNFSNFPITYYSSSQCVWASSLNSYTKADGYPRYQW